MYMTDGPSIEDFFISDSYSLNIELLGFEVSIYYMGRANSTNKTR